MLVDIKLSIFRFFLLGTIVLASHVSALAQSPCEVSFTLGSDSLEITDNSSCLPLRIEGFAEISSFQLGISFPNVDLQFKEINIRNSNISSISIVHHSNNDESVIALIWDNEEEVLFQEGEVVLELCFDVLSLAVEGYNVDIDGAMLDLGNIAKNNSQEFMVCSNIGRIETPCSISQFEVHPSFALNNKDRCRDNDTTTLIYPYELHDSADFPLTFQLYRFGILDYEFVYNSPDPAERVDEVAVYNGDYTFFIQNRVGCIDSAFFSVIPRFGDAERQVTGFGGHVISHTCAGTNDGSIIEYANFYAGDSGVWNTGVMQSFRENGFKYEIQDLAPGSYTLERHTGGCIPSAFYEIENIPTYHVNYNTRFATCDGSDGSIWIETNPPGNYKYSWEGRSDTTAIIENLTPGTYQVTVTNPEGCEVERSIELPMTGYIQLEWESEVSFPDCRPDTKASRSISLKSNNIAGADFIWSTGEVSSGTSATATQLESGVQWVYAHTSTCASDTMFFEVPIASKFDITIDSSMSSFEVCPGNTARIQLSYSESDPPTVYNESGNEIGWQFDLVPGTHTLRVISGNGCEESWTITIIEIVFERGSYFDFVNLDTMILCPEEVALIEFIALDSSVHELYLNGNVFLEGDEIPFVVDDNVISITNSLGCTWDTLIIVEERMLDISVPGDFTIEEGREIGIVTIHDEIEPLIYTWTATNPWSCAWEDCRVIDYNPLESETIYLNVRNDLGCTYEDSMVVTVIDTMEVDTVVVVIPPSGEDFYIPNIISQSSAINNEFCVALTDVIETVDFFALYDRWGNQVALASDPSSARSVCLTESLSLQSQQLSSGVYVYVIQFTYVDGQTVSRSGNVTML